MTINKEHKEFYAIDMGTEGWHTPPGYPKGMRRQSGVAFVPDYKAEAIRQAIQPRDPA